MKVVINGYVTYEAAPYLQEPRFGFYPFKPAPEIFSHLVIVSEHSIEIDVPDDFDPRPEQIKNLEAQQQKARADFEKLCTDIQRQISKLQALEHSA